MSELLQVTIEYFVEFVEDIFVSLSIGVVSLSIILISVSVRGLPGRNKKKKTSRKERKHYKHIAPAIFIPLKNSHRKQRVHAAYNNAINIYWL